MKGPPKYDKNDPAIQHSLRFRKVANGYPARVIEAYEGDLAAAARDSDEQVAERVRQWEMAHHCGPIDWVWLGQVDEGREVDEAIDALDAMKTPGTN